MAALDPSYCVFTTVQESLRLQKDSVLGLMDKGYSLQPSSFCRLVGMNFYARKRHTSQVQDYSYHSCLALYRAAIYPMQLCDILISGALLLASQI